MYRTLSPYFVADVTRSEAQDPPAFRRQSSPGWRGRQRSLLAATLVCAALAATAVAPQPAAAHRRPAHGTPRARLKLPTDAGAAVATSAYLLSERR